MAQLIRWVTPVSLQSCPILVKEEDTNGSKKQPKWWRIDQPSHAAVKIQLISKQMKRRTPISKRSVRSFVRRPEWPDCPIYRCLGEFLSGDNNFFALFANIFGYFWKEIIEDMSVVGNNSKYSRRVFNGNVRHSKSPFPFSTQCLLLLVAFFVSDLSNC